MCVQQLPQTKVSLFLDVNFLVDGLVLGHKLRVALVLPYVCCCVHACSSSSGFHSIVYCVPESI